MSGKDSKKIRNVVIVIVISVLIVALIVGLSVGLTMNHSKHPTRPTYPPRGCQETIAMCTDTTRRLEPAYSNCLTDNNYQNCIKPSPQDRCQGIMDKCKDAFGNTEPALHNCVASHGC